MAFWPREQSKSYQKARSKLPLGSLSSAYKARGRDDGFYFNTDFTLQMAFCCLNFLNFEAFVSGFEPASPF